MADTRHDGDASHGRGAERGGDERSSVNWGAYANLLAMVATSTVVMYAFMYWNTYRWSDVWLSETRAYMAVLMGGTMLAIMLSFMLHMYRTRWVNLALYGASLALFALGLFLVRSQITVQDESWMKSMIPHHSIAVMVSERAEITDPRARKLADEIIAAQEKEIAEMEYLIRTLREDGELAGDYPTGQAEGPTPVAASLAEALARPALSTVDPSAMSVAEVGQVLDDPVCTFRFAEGQGAVVTVDPSGRGVMKITGQLVPLAQASGDVAGASVLEADGLRLTIEPRGGEGAADGAADLVLDMQTEPPLRVGYAGRYACDA